MTKFITQEERTANLDPELLTELKELAKQPNNLIQADQMF
jgi:hypothetical protein